MFKNLEKNVLFGMTIETKYDHTYIMAPMLTRSCIKWSSSTPYFCVVFSFRKMITFLSEGGGGNVSPLTDIVNHFGKITCVWPIRTIFYGIG